MQVNIYEIMKNLKFVKKKLLIWILIQNLIKKKKINACSLLWHFLR